MLNKLKFTDRRAVAFCHDITMVVVAWFLAYELRQNLRAMPAHTLWHAVSFIPIVVTIQIGFFILFGLYRGIWRFASIPDLIRMLKAVSCGVLTLIFCVHFLLKNHYHIPRSVPLLYAVFLLLLLSFGRLTVRYRKDYHHDNSNEIKRVLVVGSGNEAESVIREMLRDTKGRYKPIAIVDSDPSTRHREIHSVRVIDTFEKIKSVVIKHNIEMIVIALSDASSAVMNLIVRECNAAKIPYRIIPSFKNTVQEGRLLSTLREVDLEDLLGRETYQIDMGLFQQNIDYKSVLVTGGGGSIGSELCRQIASLNPKELLILDHCEANLYQIDLELREKFPYLTIKTGLVDILNLELLDTFFATYKPQLIFHAAAYKHVPMLESQALIAVRNNIIGSKYVLDLAIKYNAEIFVQVSTDKAVNPTSIMGLTKRVAEIYCQYLSQFSKTKIVTVRFGNVLGSTGSVVPLFKEQLKQGGPLTVTHPDITRYFMTIPESCRLILQAMTMGRGGEIFVLDMGEPIKIKDLAEQMIRLSGKSDEIKIVYTGLRAGEKLWEDLFYHAESIVKTSHKKIFRAAACYFELQSVQKTLSEIVYYCGQQNEAVVLEKALQLVPEYQGSRKMPVIV